MFATEFSDAFTVVPEFLDASYCLYQSSPNASYCSYQSSLMPFTGHTRVLWCFYCSYQSFLMPAFYYLYQSAFTVCTRVPLLFVPEFSDAFTVHTRVLWYLLLFIPEFSDASTVRTRVFWCFLLFVPECFYCSYQSSQMPLLFVPEFSDAFTVRTRVLCCSYQSSLLFVSEFSDAFNFHSRVLWCFYCSYQSSLMPLLFVLEFSKASDNLARVFSSHNYCNPPAEFANVLMVLYFILLTDVVEM